MTLLSIFSEDLIKATGEIVKNEGIQEYDERLQCSEQ